MIDPRRIEVIDDATAAMFRAMSLSRRVELVSQAHKIACALQETGIRDRHPDWTDDQVREEVIRRMSHGTT